MRSFKRNIYRLNTADEVIYECTPLEGFALNEAPQSFYWIDGLTKTGASTRLQISVDYVPIVDSQLYKQYSYTPNPGESGTQYLQPGQLVQVWYTGENSGGGNMYVTLQVTGVTNLIEGPAIQTEVHTTEFPNDADPTYYLEFYMPSTGVNLQAITNE